MASVPLPNVVFVRLMMPLVTVALWKWSGSLRLSGTSLVVTSANSPHSGTPSGDMSSALLLSGSVVRSGLSGSVMDRSPVRPPGAAEP